MFYTGTSVAGEGGKRVHIYIADIKAKKIPQQTLISKRKTSPILANIINIYGKYNCLICIDN